MAYNMLVRARRLLHRTVIVNGVRMYYNGVWNTRIGKGSRISLGAKIDKSNPAGVVIGEDTAVTFGAAIVTHDFVNNIHLTTRIGSHCFIGANAMIMPGVTIGDHCIVGACSVVMRDVPANSVVMGNPARVIERDIRTGRWGMRLPGLASAHPAAVPAPVASGGGVPLDTPAFA